MQGDKTLQITDDLSVASERDSRIDELLNRRKMQLLQPRNVTLRELGVGDISQRLPRQRASARSNVATALSA
jgi:hypothetical protein